MNFIDLFYALGFVQIGVTIYNVIQSRVAISNQEQEVVQIDVAKAYENGGYKNHLTAIRLELAGILWKILGLFTVLRVFFGISLVTYIVFSIMVVKTAKHTTKAQLKHMVTVINLFEIGIVSYLLYQHFHIGI